jgi:hypothetical protein
VDDDGDQNARLRDFPVPGSGKAAVAIPAPGTGPLQWAGSPAAALEVDGGILLAHRLRYTEGASTVVARSDDGERFETLATLTDTQFGAMSMEWPALVRAETGRWRLYVCCATQGSKKRTNGGWEAWICCHPLDEPDEEDRLERTGLAHRTPGRFEQVGDEPVSDVRYLDVLPLPTGGYRLYYEARLPDESHELHTELIAG